MRDPRNDEADEGGVPAGAGLAVRAARDALTVRRVFGDPYERAGVTVFPVAKVRGMGGMGFGSGPTEGGTDRPGAGEGAGGGGGFGVTARPVGAYILADGRLRWEPALDLDRTILGGQVLGAVALLALAWAWRGGRRHR